MAQPPVYNRQFSFTDFQASNPADPLPSAQHEVELNAIKATLDAILNNIALIQRDDGELANLSVGNDQLEVSLRTGINPPTVWTVAPTSYSVNDTVVFDDGLGRSELWLALVAHTSTSDFDTDSLVSGFWRKLADFSTLSLEASSTNYDNTTSGLTATDVQAAIDELDALVDAFSGVVDGDKGDITVTSSGTVWTIDAGVVTTAKIAALAVDATLIAANAVTTAKILDANVTTAKLVNSAVTTAKLADNGVTLDKLEHGTSGDILYYGASGEPFRLAKGTDDQVLTLATGLPAWVDRAAVGSFGTQLLHVREEQTSGTDGGTFTQTTQVKRTLNTVLTNEITGASLSTSVITLPDGDYYIEAKAPGFAVNEHKAWLQNTSDATVEVLGNNANVTAQVAAYSFVSGRFTVASGPKTYELQNECTATKTTDGLGEAAAIAGKNEVYTEVMIWKVA